MKSKYSLFLRRKLLVIVALILGTSYLNAQNLLTNVSQILAHSKIHILNAALNTHPDFSATLHLTIQIENTDQLSQILTKINCAPNIIDVSRKT